MFGGGGSIRRRGTGERHRASAAGGGAGGGPARGGPSGLWRTPCRLARRHRDRLRRAGGCGGHARPDRPRQPGQSRRPYPRSRACGSAGGADDAGGGRGICRRTARACRSGVRADRPAAVVREIPRIAGASAGLRHRRTVDRGAAAGVAGRLAGVDGGDRDRRGGIPRWRVPDRADRTDRGGWRGAGRGTGRCGGLPSSAAHRCSA